MNILLCYLPYAMFSGACDVALPESETQRDGGRPAEASDVTAPESLIITNRRSATNLH